MASLVAVTKESRLILKIGAMLLGVGILIYMTVQGANLVRSIFFPKPPTPPAQAFGKLPHLVFPSQGTPGLTYIVNTLDTGDKLPSSIAPLKDRIFIYKLQQPTPDLLALENTRKTIDSENFVENQFKISDTLYQWSQSKTGVIIQYDIVSKDFIVSSNYLTNPQFASVPPMPSEDRIKTDAINLVKILGGKSQSLDLDKTRVEYLELSNGTLIPASNINTARYARITFFQNNVDEIPIIYDTPTESILSFVGSYPDSKFQVLEGTYYLKEPLLEDKSDYPIKSIATAYEDLKQGNAYMINAKNQTTITITNIDLRYYLNKDSNLYLLPVYVFSGIDFTAYVEAIPSTSLGN